MAATKNGIGIWQHYRTNEKQRADGLIFKGRVNDELVEARLYWAPADWRNPDGSGKRPYVVVKVFRGEFNSFTGYEYELRWDSYLGDERPRRNWKELLAIGEKFGMEQMEEYVSNAIWYHETMLDLGCTYECHTYYFPQGKTQWVQEQLRARWNERKAA